jgi:diguanylate cyclase (GGDEF)-like protein
VTNRASAYRGADLPRARRFTRAVWLIGCTAALAAIPLSPPTVLIGDTGWIVAAAAAVPTLLGGLVLATRKTVGWRGLLVVTYLGLALVTLLQGLAGPHAHYVAFDLLLVCCVGLVHPYPIPMVFAAAMAASRLGLALLNAHDRIDAIVGATLESLIWTLLAAVLCTVMRETREQRLELHEQRSIDPLTSLSNRRSFDELLARRIDEARVDRSPLSLVLVDVNRFKLLNDRHGHLAGDHQLVAIGQALSDGVRPGDACFRWGGDEFAILLPGADEPAATVIGERLALLVASRCTEPEPLTISVGVAALRPEDDAETLTARADARLLAAKPARDEPTGSSEIARAGC